MHFRDSGLPNNKILQDAYNHSLAHAMALQQETLKHFTQDMHAIHEQNMLALEADRKDKIIDEKTYKHEKETLEKMFQENLKMGPRIVEERLLEIFKHRRLAPALELQQYSDNAQPELVAAILLYDTVRSPIDFANITKKFGETVAGLIAEWIHIDVYQSERDINLAKSGDDTKRVYLAYATASLNQNAEHLRRGGQLIVPPGMEENNFREAQKCWGQDQKLNARFVDVFNTLMGMVHSSFRIEVDSGKPQLVKGNLTPPNGHIPPGPNNTSGLGDDPF
jgi:hypothetical protein